MPTSDQPASSKMFGVFYCMPDQKPEQTAAMPGSTVGAGKGYWRGDCRKILERNGGAMLFSLYFILPHIIIKSNIEKIAICCKNAAERRPYERKEKR